MTTPTPDWLSYDDAGNADVTLSRPLEIEGARVSVIRLREPTVNDQLASEAGKGADAAKEITMLANLSDHAPADIQRLPLRDYKRLQTAFMGFID